MQFMKVRILPFCKELRSRVDAFYWLILTCGMVTTVSMLIQCGPSSSHPTWNYFFLFFYFILFYIYIKYIKSYTNKKVT